MFYTMIREVQTGLQDLEMLRSQGQRGLLKINQLMAGAWTHWVDARPFHTPENKSIYELLVQFFKDLPAVNNCTLEDMPSEFKKAEEALQHMTAVKGWHVRVHGDFWIVGADETDEGTFLVSNVNRNAVYKVLGVRNSLFRMIEPTFGHQPILMKLTMIPWYGRLVYDGVVVPAHGKPGPPEIADEELAKTLKKNVMTARKEGRIVEKLVQLQLPGAQASIPIKHSASSATNGNLSS
jgi:hypothetical protein